MNPTSLPAGACDCHVHVYEEGFPVAPSAVSKPPHGPLAAYRQVQAQCGLERVVLVQPTAYGFDNRCLLEALAHVGEGARGIAVVAPDASDAELERLHQQFPPTAQR